MPPTCTQVSRWVIAPIPLEFDGMYWQCMALNDHACIGYNIATVYSQCLVRTGYVFCRTLVSYINLSWGWYFHIYLYLSTKTGCFIFHHSLKAAVMTKQTNSHAGSLWRLKMFLHLACNGTDELCLGTTFETARFCVRVGLCILTMLDNMQAKPWLNEGSPSGQLLHLSLKIAFKRLFCYFSWGLHCIDRDIVSCFITENIWLLTFCHGLW